MFSPGLIVWFILWLLNKWLSCELRKSIDFEEILIGSWTFTLVLFMFSFMIISWVLCNSWLDKLNWLFHPVELLSYDDVGIGDDVCIDVICADNIVIDKIIF